MDKSELRHRLMIAFIVAVALIGLILVIVDWKEVRAVIAQADWRPIPAAVLFTALSYACLSLGFAAACHPFGIRLQRRDLFDIGFVTTVINNLISTGGVAGYSVRFLLMQERGASLQDALAASLFHTYLNSLGMLALLIGGLAYLLAGHSLSHGMFVGVSIAAALIVLAFLLATAVVLSARVRRALLRFAGRAARTILHREADAAFSDLDETIGRGVAAMRAQPGGLLLLMILIAADWSSSLAVLWLCFIALGSPLSIGVLVTGFATGITAGVLSMVPGGLGVQEGSMAAVYALLGVPVHQAALAAILFRAVYYLLPYVVSLPCYGRLLRRVESLAPQST